MKKNHSKKIPKLILLTFIILTFTLYGCKGFEEEYSKSGFFFDTVVNVSIYDNDKSHADKVLTKCIDFCTYYDSIFSVNNPKSDIYKINNSNESEVVVSEDTIFILEKAIEYSKQSNGLFDITIEPLYELWDFNSSEHINLPDKNNINELIKNVDYSNINISPINKTVTLKKGSKITLGALAKGYIADKLKEYLISEGITSGVINLGGNIQTFGTKPDKTPYTIGIQKPFSNNGEIATTVQIINKSVVTSGTYQRYFELNNICYHHIINPNTGYPADSNLSSVSIITKNSLDADAYSTICMLLGYEDSVDFLNSLNMDISAVFIDNNGNIKELSR